MNTEIQQDTNVLAIKLLPWEVAIRYKDAETDDGRANILLQEIVRLKAEAAENEKKLNEWWSHHRNGTPLAWGGAVLEQTPANEVGDHENQ